MSKTGKNCSREMEGLEDFIGFYQTHATMGLRNFDQPVLVTVLKYGKHHASTRVLTYGEAIDWLKAQAKNSGFNVCMPKVKNNGKGVEKELVAELERQFALGTPTLVG